MKSHRLLVSCLVVGFASSAWGAELNLNWQGMKGQTDQIISLAVGGEAVVEVWITLSDGDSLNAAAFGNEAEPRLSQTAVTPNPDIDWTTDSMASPNGESLGDGVQWLGLGSHLGSDLYGPGEYLLGTQTLVLNDVGDGSDTEVTISTEGITVVDHVGNLYTLRPSSSPRADNVRSVHIAGGSPGYTITEFGVEYVDEREPLIVQPVAGGGGGGGGGGLPDNTNDNTVDNTNDNVTDDNTNDNTVDNTNDNVTDDNTNDNTVDNTNDNTDDNTNDNTDANTNDNTVVTNDNTNSTSNTNTNSGVTPTPAPTGGGICGLGIVGMLPASLVGLLALQAGRRRQH